MAIMEVPIEDASVVAVALGDSISRYLIELIEAYGMAIGSKEMTLIKKGMFIEIAKRVDT